MAPKDRKRLSEKLGKLLGEAGTAGFMRAALEGAPQQRKEAPAGHCRVQLAIPKLRE
ncbi:MAG: hypothetical protein LBC69_03495 [Eubacteriaceae bacterium]|jgi:hypothetical protein|nr:hypothetical protein [Eubacteriaceae bacterium]